MPHYPKPLYRKSRNRWYVQIDGKQHNLGLDQGQAFVRYHQLMQRFKQPLVESASHSVLMLIDRFLDWCHKNRAPATYEWYQSRLQEFAVIRVAGSIRIT